MELLMNGLLSVATLFAGGYCWVLARRVRDLKSLDKGLGGSIVTLTRQIELARTTLDEARAASKSSRQDLSQLVSRADTAAGQLRLLIAAAPSAPVAEPVPVAPAFVAPTLPAAEHQAAPERPAAGAGATLLSLMARSPASEPDATAAAEPDPVPKPRLLVPIENPLRRFRPEAAPPAGSSEDDILAALRALAGTDR